MSRASVTPVATSVRSSPGMSCSFESDRAVIQNSALSGNDTLAGRLDASGGACAVATGELPCGRSRGLSSWIRGCSLLVDRNEEVADASLSMRLVARSVGVDVEWLFELFHSASTGRVASNRRSGPDRTGDPTLLRLVLRASVSKAAFLANRFESPRAKIRRSEGVREGRVELPRPFGHRILRLVPPGTDPGPTCRPMSSDVVLSHPGRSVVSKM
jgi:hypothetical protein